MKRYALFRVDSMECMLFNKIFIMEVDSDLESAQRMMEAWWNSIPNEEYDKGIMGECIIYPASCVLNDKNEADKLYFMQSRLLKVQEESVKRMMRTPIIAAFPDGNKKSYPSVTAFLDDMRVPRWYGSRINRSTISGSVPLKSRSYPQLNGVVLRYAG